jgi:hypothetical protein
MPSRLRRRRRSVPDPTPRVGRSEDRGQHARGRKPSRKELRRRVRKLRDQLGDAQRELDLLRSSSLEVFPDVALAEGVAETIAAVKSDRLTYLTHDQLTSLATCVAEADRSGRPGILIEAGAALGGSAIVMAKTKEAGRPMRVYDVFGMIPPPTAADGDDVHERYATITAGESGGLGGDTYYGYRDDLVGEVTASFARHGVPLEDNAVTLVQGRFEDTLVVDEPVALAHVDGDWYESTMTCLERIAPRLVEGGRIVVDDYHSWTGCRRAVDEYFADRPGYRVEMRAKVHVVRVQTASDVAEGAGLGAADVPGPE